MSHGGPSGPLDRLLGPVAGVIIGLLLAALAVGVSDYFDTRLVGIGESIWPGYAADLRGDPIAPECNLAELDRRLATCPAETDAVVAAAPAADDEPVGGADPGAAPAAAQDHDGGGGTGG
jgi:hypothetical protein